MSIPGERPSYSATRDFPTDYGSAPAQMREADTAVAARYGAQTQQRRLKFEVPDQGADAAINTVRALALIDEEIELTRKDLPSSQRHELTQVHLMLDLLKVKLLVDLPRKSGQERAIAAGKVIPDKQRIHTSTMAAQGLMMIINSCVDLFDYSRVDTNQPQSAGFWAGVTAVDSILQHLNAQYGIRRIPVACGDSFDPEIMESPDLGPDISPQGPLRVGRLLNMGFADADGNIYERAKVQLTSYSDIAARAA